MLEIKRIKNKWAVQALIKNFITDRFYSSSPVASVVGYRL